MLKSECMTNTEFIMREKHADEHPLRPAGEIHFGVVEGALVLGFLAAFMGLVFLLAK